MKTQFFTRLFERLWNLLPDKCDICKGKRGGTRGNENVLGGFVICDYCHADIIDLRKHGVKS